MPRHASLRSLDDRRVRGCRHEICSIGLSWHLNHPGRHAGAEVCTPDLRVPAMPRCVSFGSKLPSLAPCRDGPGIAISGPLLTRRRNRGVLDRDWARHLSGANDLGLPQACQPSVRTISRAQISFHSGLLPSSPGQFASWTISAPLHIAPVMKNSRCSRSEK